MDGHYQESYHQSQYSMQQDNTYGQQTTPHYGENESYYRSQQYPPPAMPSYGNTAYGGQASEPYAHQQGHLQQQSYGGNASNWYAPGSMEHHQVAPMPNQQGSYSSGQYPAQMSHPPEQSNDEKGFLGAAAGGAAGAYGGHKMGHGLIGGLGGAVAGSMLQDAYKKHRKHDKPHSRPHSSNSNSSSSSSGHHESSYPASSVHRQDHGRPMGNFRASTRQVWLEGHNHLIAECANVNGHHHRSAIDLNSFITNDNGEFAWARPGDGGNFSHSARHVQLVDGGSVLQADLHMVDGHWRTDRIWLDERIENDNGHLRYLA